MLRTVAVVVLLVIIRPALAQGDTLSREWMEFGIRMFKAQSALLAAGIKDCSERHPATKLATEDSYGKIRREHANLFRSFEDTPDYRELLQAETDKFAKAPVSERDDFCAALPRFFADTSEQANHAACATELMAQQAPNTSPHGDARPMAKLCEGLAARARELRR